MNADELRSLQAPLKAQYRERPDTALVTLRAEGQVGQNITCQIETGKARVEAGLHPATGGDGRSACSADMLLEALVGCAGRNFKRGRYRSKHSFARRDDPSGRRS